MIEIKLVKINPAKASSLLEKNKRNRRIVQSTVDTYARDMKEGRWTVSESAICIDINGGLINGQHRLWAVVESGVTIQAFLATGYAQDDMLQMDSGLLRTFADSYNLKHNQRMVSNAHAAIAKVILRGPSDKTAVSRSELERVVDRHYAAICFALQAVPSRSGIRRAHVQAPIARAYYHPDRAGVENFCRILATGEVREPRDKAPLLLRDFASRLSAKAIDVRVEIYWKTEHALLSFLDGTPLKLLRAASREAFPIPDGATVEAKLPERRRR